MKWDKGNTTILPQIVPGTTIRLRPPWQKKAPQGAQRRPGAPTLRVVTATKPPESADKA